MVGTTRGEGRRRAIVERVTPEVDCGRFPAKRVVGDLVAVEADAFTDGHDALSCRLLHRRDGEAEWHEAVMRPLGNDRWRGTFTVPDLGRYHYTVEAWVDRFETWRRDIAAKWEAGQDVHVDLLIGAEIVASAASRAASEDGAGRADGTEQLRRWAGLLADDERAVSDRVSEALSDRLRALVARHPEREEATRYERELTLVVDPVRARWSTWYEMFPRSASSEPGRHGTFADVEDRLDDIAAMGFDVLYLPPIHPIGHTHRKGPNNAATAGPEDVGSPWAIGSEDGGHKAVHPDLGTVEDFRMLVERARQRGIEVALDIAFQCSPDHPYVKEHPEWFRWRPDGTVQYAENPPKKYEDIYPFDFETDAWPELWEELKSVFEFWIDQGVRMFRVDNPHTKPFAFWEWCIGSLKADHPELVFLSEAFTRPRVMHRLAKLGFTQSYTYFAWRHTRWDLTEYFRELNEPPARDYFRPNAWPNTPDILTEELQVGGRPAFIARLVLAGTLAANYGIYGPAFELMEHEPREPGSEEYRNSEKYQLRHWDLDDPESLRDLIARLNAIRRRNPALQADWSLRFHPTDNEQLLCYSKTNEDSTNTVLTLVNLDPHHVQAGWTSLDLDALGLDASRPFQMHDELGGGRYLWDGAHNYAELNPHVLPAHVFVVRRHVRTEADFDYYQ